MFLTLEIVAGPQFERLPARVHTFGIEGGRVGRTPDNDWPIPYEFLHGQHASVRFYNGLFFIEKRGTNRVAVNNPDRDLATDDSYPIKDGDRLFFDDLEVAVRVTAARPATERALAPPPPVSAPLARPELGADSTGTRHGPAEGLVPMVDAGDSTIDSFLKGGRTAAAAGRDSRASLVDRAAVIHDRVSLLKSQSQFPPPDLQPGWDKTVLPLAPPSPGSGEQPGGLLPGWDKTNFSTGVTAEQLRTRQPESVPTPPPSPTQVRTKPSAVAQGELAILLAAFGVDPSQLAPGELAVIGRALRNAVSGIIGVLQTRSEARARFRLGATQGMRTDNNPLKVAPNLDDALYEFFRRRAPGTTPFDVAVGRALEEVQWHQLATLDAMETTFKGLLARFDPAAIEEEVDRTQRRGALVGRSTRLWEAYVAAFERLTGDRDDSFRKIFGADFSRAYDTAIDRRRTISRNQRT